MIYSEMFHWMKFLFFLLFEDMLIQILIIARQEHVYHNFPLLCLWTSLSNFLFYFIFFLSYKNLMSDVQVQS